MPNILELNVGDPANVTLTATGVAPQTGSTTVSSFDGITLLDVFAVETDVPFSDVIGDLAAPGALPYDRFFDVGGGLDLNLYVNDFGAADQLFSSSSPAFTGSSTLGFDLTGLPFQPEGGGGFVRTGLNGDTILGAYVVVVPEPASAGLLLGAAGLLIRCRK